MAPSGRVPLTGAAASTMAPSRKLVACSDEPRREMENALDDVKGNGVVRPRFADAGREDETKNSAASFLVGAHGAEQSRGGNARPGRQRPQAANQRDAAGNVISARQAELVAEEGRGHHAPGYRLPVLIPAVLLDAFLWIGAGWCRRPDLPPTPH